MKAQIGSAFLTNRGYMRPENEDSILIAGTVLSGISMESGEVRQLTSLPALFCVADGIGGAAYGEIASMTVLSIFADYVPIPQNKDDIVRMIHKARKVLDGMARENQIYFGFGTTIAGLVLMDRQAIAFNCGDSRIYLINEKRIERLSHDHSLVQELHDRGEITDEQRYIHPLRNIITSSISGDLNRPEPGIYMNSIPLTGSERFLLCTDGVWEVLKDPELYSLCNGRSLQHTVNGILSACLARGGPDNISLILLSHS